jgi:hypothetical protein
MRITRLTWTGGLPMRDCMVMIVFAFGERGKLKCKGLTNAVLVSCR